MKRKILAMVLGMSMLLTSACGTSDGTPEKNNSAEKQEISKEDADPFGKYEEPVKFTVAMSVDPNEVFPEGDSFTENQYTRYIKEQLNVDIEFLWTASASDYDTKVNLAITSNELPDAMVVNATQFNQMYKAGQLADLIKLRSIYNHCIW